MAIVFLSMTWLLPNHSPPWSSFHSDAWVAAVLAVIGLVVTLRSRQPIIFNGLEGMAAALMAVPLIQYFFGMLPFAGQAWVVGAYLAGFLLALLVGQQWCSWRPLWMGDIIFSAIGMASIFSVGLQLQQWLGLTTDGNLDVWILSSNGIRPHANIGQPNQLSTLLLWGLLACAWGVWRRVLGSFTALLSVVFLICGLVLTQSRTGASTLVLLVVASWIWRRLWGKRHVHWYVSGLGVFYGILSGVFTGINRLLLLAEPLTAAQRINEEIRPLIWRLLLNAVGQHPFFGYGWNQILLAQITAANENFPINVPFSQSHNLFLDLILWMGVPLGLLLSAGLIAWLVVALRRAKQQYEIFFLLLVVVVGIHAMFEYPLHYAYFLLPTGLVMGALSHKLNIWNFSGLPQHNARLILVAFWSVTVVVFGTIVFDYFKIEEAYLSLQIESAQIENSRPVKIPDVILLTDLKEIQRFRKFELKAEVSDADLQWARDITRISPSSRNFMALAILLGLNNHPAEAREWLFKMCLIVPLDQCASAPSRWLEAQKLHPELENIVWPHK